MQAHKAYDELIRRTREAALLDSCHELLGWDELTYMPRAGVAHRGNQMALLAGLVHEQSTHPRIAELLAEVEGSELVRDPLSAEAVNVREIRRSYERSTRIPRTLVEELARTASLAQQEWEIARAESDFARFRPWLEKFVALKRSEAELLGYAEVPYDALLDEYEPHTRTADIAHLFDALQKELVPLAQAIVAAQRVPEVGVLQREFPLDRQRVFGEAAAAAIGFDFERGRLDTAVHPFSSAIGPGDCRITTRYCVHNFSDAFFAILHEAGHGLYEQGLDLQHHGTPMGEVGSVGIHESQARLWENTIGRSRAFWRHFFPEARQVFPRALGDVSLDDFYRAANRVQPSLIRVTADEVTYNLHILIRFDLERALIAGDLQAADVPAAWNEAYGRYLGVRPANDAEGCLQDGHWSSGLFGYFPTYTLGNLIAAQLFAQARVDLGDLEEEFACGKFARFLAWLRDRVHRHGHRFSAPRLIEHVTGSALDYRPFVAALRRKYEVA
jgi:carboxypeptidase Taq